MVHKKRKSKRMTLHKKYKIAKRCKEHKKKLKKGALTNAGSVGKRLKREDNRIPNAWPYKEDLLREIAAAKDKMEAVKLRQKEKRKEEINKRRGVLMGQSDEAEEEEKMEEGAGDESEGEGEDEDEECDEGSREEDGDEEEEEEGVKGLHVGQNSRRAYLSALRKVIESADVILHVLDARDPLGTRSSTIEEMIRAHPQPKKLVYLLNKADLVSREILVGWLSYLRQYHPTLAFKSNTQTQRGHLSIQSGPLLSRFDDAAQGGGLHATTHAVGAEELMSLLKNYSRSDATGKKSIITVGIVGFPNVGKSSLINSLTRSRAVGVSAMPGFTKALQEVILDKNIRLIDSPGVVFADGNSAATILRNCVNVDDLDDVISPVQAILDKCLPQYLMQLYVIPSFKQNDAMSFLAVLAKTQGKLKKGGVPNYEAVAKQVLHDWNHGKIKYYCRAPPVTAPPAAVVTTASAKAKAAPATDSTSRAAEVESALKQETVLLTSASVELNMDDWTGMDNRVISGLFGDVSHATPAAINKAKAQMFVGLDRVAEEVTAVEMDGAK